MDIKIISGYDRADDIRELFSEYTAMLVEGDAAFAGYLEIQHYDNELEDLKAKYGEPLGRLFIAYSEGRPAGCIALKPLDTERCELKRLYVRPEFRGNGLAKMLMNLILSEARKAGYKYMYLDTLPFLDTAIQMYKRLGFYEIGRYNDSPLDSTIYMRKEL